jgi:hypothetical protein
MPFPNDVKLAMRDCLLKIFWSKDDIVTFFRNNSCSAHDIKILGQYKEVHRNQIVDQMFSYLDSKADEGIAQYRSMMKSLVEWNHFDPYYFDKIKKLNRIEAETALSHLRQLQEIRDAKIKEQRREREKKESDLQKSKTSLTEVKEKFLRLLQGTDNIQKRGYELEKILQELAVMSSLEMTEPFRVNGEQIDGAIKYDGEHYIVEAKWQEKEAANEPVYQFAGKVEGKMYGRGIFVSVHGFSENVVKSLVQGKALRTIFVDGADLTVTLEGLIDFKDLIDKKVKAAQTKGLIYIDAITGKEKSG